MPFAAGGLGLVQRVDQRRAGSSSAARASNDARPIVHWTMPALSVRYCTWPALAFFTAVRDVRRDGADLRVRHQAARAEDLAELADDAHRVRRGDHDVEVHEAFLDLARRGRRSRRCRRRRPCAAFGLVALREHRDAHGLAGAGGQHDRAAHRLVGLLRVDAEVARRRRPTRRTWRSRVSLTSFSASSTG